MATADGVDEEQKQPPEREFVEQSTARSGNVEQPQQDSISRVE